MMDATTRSHSSEYRVPKKSGMVLGLLWVLVRYIEAYVVESVYLHLLVYGTCNDVAWCQRQTLVVFLHERLAIGQTEYATIATHGLGDEIGGMGLTRMIECRGVELYELHVLHHSLWHTTPTLVPFH